MHASAGNERQAEYRRLANAARAEQQRRRKLAANDDRFDNESQASQLSVTTLTAAVVARTRSNRVGQPRRS